MEARSVAGVVGRQYAPHGADRTGDSRNGNEYDGRDWRPQALHSLQSKPQRVLLLLSYLTSKLVDRLKQDFGRLCRIEGKETGDWVLIDAGDVIVHVFRPEVREFYKLEKMWTGERPTDESAPH